MSKELAPVGTDLGLDVESQRRDPPPRFSCGFACAQIATSIVTRLVLVIIFVLAALLIFIVNLLIFIGMIFYVMPFIQKFLWCQKDDFSRAKRESNRFVTLDSGRKSVKILLDALKFSVLALVPFCSSLEELLLFYEDALGSVVPNHYRVIPVAAALDWDRLQRYTSFSREMAVSSLSVPIGQTVLFLINGKETTQILLAKSFNISKSSPETKSPRSSTRLSISAARIRTI